jgi:hypothetical protein
MKRLFIPFLAIGMMVACESTPETTEENTEVKSMVDDHDGHDHGSGVPDDMPQVPEGAEIYFSNLKDGDVVPSEVYVEFGAKGITVEPAGVVKENYGHHHLIINGESTPYGEAVPADETHIHYGGGQTGDTISLSTGITTLTLQFADGLHRSYGEDLSSTIKVKVLEE